MGELKTEYQVVLTQSVIEATQTVPGRKMLQTAADAFLALSSHEPAGVVAGLDKSAQVLIATTLTALVSGGHAAGQIVGQAVQQSLDKMQRI